MAKPKHLSEEHPCSNNDAPLTPAEKETSTVAERQYINGSLDDHLSVSKAIASKKAIGWIKSNWLTVIGVLIPAGLLWLLPVTRWQLEDAKTDLSGKIAAVSQKVEAHDSAIAEIKASQIRVEDKTDKILFRLTPPIPAEFPASSPPIEKPKAKAKRPHATRGASLAKTLGLR